MRPWPLRQGTLTCGNWLRVCIVCVGARLLRRGHLNQRTIKDVSWFGPKSEYLVSGSDDGRLFMWQAASGQVVLMQKGDRRIVNCMAGHPSACLLATGGIDSEVKVWEADAAEPDDLAELQQVSLSWHPHSGRMLRCNDDFLLCVIPKDRADY